MQLLTRPIALIRNKWIAGFEYTLLGFNENDGVTDGARTRDNRNHNPGLYQLSYSHHSAFLQGKQGVYKAQLYAVANDTKLGLVAGNPAQV